MSRPATCHPERPRYGRGLCLSCYRQEPDVLEKARLRSANNRRNLSPKQWREVARLRKYGAGPREVSSILATQSFRCPLCSTPLDEQSGVVDHCHATGNIRGFLCKRCNWMLGHSKDSPETLRHAADYVEAAQNGKGRTRNLLIEGK